MILPGASAALIAPLAPATSDFPPASPRDGGAAP